MILDPLLDNAPCGFVSVADDGTMLAVNLTLARTLGCERPALEGWHIQKILSPGTRVFYNTHVYPLLKMHRLVEEVYLPLRNERGEDIPMLMNGRRRGTNQEEVNDLIFVRMLQRHKYEDQLLEARRLAEAARDTKAKFLSMMSHDLRSPLTAITGNADLIASGALGPVNSDQLESAESIAAAARDMNRLIEDILDFAQADAGMMRVRIHEILLRDVIARAARLMRRRMEEAGIEFEAQLCSSEIAASGDADRLQQILLNLLSNAVKFTPPGGRVTLACASQGDHVALRVADTGIGIPSDQRERIFEPFVQLQSDRVVAKPGVGLGLSISRELARAMGGELSAEEGAGGNGTVFTLLLPAAMVSRSS